MCTVFSFSFKYLQFFQWFHFKVFDSDNVSGNDYIGDVLVEMDPFVQKRVTVNQKIVSKDEKSKALLLVTPA